MRAGVENVRSGITAVGDVTQIGNSSCCSRRTSGPSMRSLDFPLMSVILVFGRLSVHLLALWSGTLAKRATPTTTTVHPPSLAPPPSSPSSAPDPNQVVECSSDPPSSGDDAKESQAWAHSGAYQVRLLGALARACIQVGHVIIGDPGRRRVPGACPDLYGARDAPPSPVPIGGRGPEAPGNCALRHLGGTQAVAHHGDFLIFS